MSHRISLYLNSFMCLFSISIFPFPCRLMHPQTITYGECFTIAALSRSPFFAELPLHHFFQSNSPLFRCRVTSWLFFRRGLLAGFLGRSTNSFRRRFMHKFDSSSSLLISEAVLNLLHRLLVEGRKTFGQETKSRLVGLELFTAIISISQLTRAASCADK